MFIKDLQEKRNKLMTDATALVAGTEVTAEQRTQFDAILAEVSVADADLGRLQAVEQYKNEQRSAVNHPRPNPGESNDPEERAEVKNERTRKSFRDYLATGRVEARDLTVANSGVAIPQMFNPQVIEAQKSYGQIYDIVNLLKTDHGNPVKMVLDDDTAAGLVAVTVGTPASEVDPTLTGKTLQVDNYTTGVIKIDNGLLTDAGFDVEAFIRDKFSKRFFRGASSLILAGNASSVASLTSSYSAGITSATINKLAYIDFASAIGALDPAYQTNSVWAMSNSTLGYVIGLTDAQARPLFLPDYGSAASGFAGSILGRPVKVVAQLPAVATAAAPVLFGDFKEGYTFRQQNPGIGILRQNELYSAGYETGFVGFARVGGVSTGFASNPAVISITIK